MIRMSALPQKANQSQMMRVWWLTATLTCMPQYSAASDDAKLLVSLLTPRTNGASGMVRRNAPDAQGCLRHHELVCGCHRKSCGRTARSCSRCRPAAHCSRRLVVTLFLPPWRDHVHQAVFQHLDFFTQHFGLAFMQADHTLPWALPSWIDVSKSEWRWKKPGF